MADPDKIQEIKEAVTIPVMARAHRSLVEAQILEALEVDPSTSPRC
jgi:pyridoxal biosynthesis lyase PdxS